MSEKLPKSQREIELEAELEAERAKHRPPSEPNYPSWRYHASLAPRVVQSAEEDKALGKGWQDTPHSSNPPTAPNPFVPETPATVVVEGAPEVDPVDGKSKVRVKA